VGGIARLLFVQGAFRLALRRRASAIASPSMNAFRTISVVLLLSSGAPALPAKTAPAPAGRLPFIEDDYARAIRDARARGVPVFVEAWAPW